MEALEEMYRQVILDESKDPYHKVYAIDDPNSSHQYNPTCGDDITLAISLDADVIKGVKWAGEGCSISMASASILSKMLEGKTVYEALQIVELFKKLMNSRGAGLEDAEFDVLGDASAFTGTSKFPARIKCALLGWAAFEGALENARSGHAPISSGHNTHDQE